MVDMHEMAPRWPKMAPKWSQLEPQDEPRMVLSCRRNANFAKSAMPSSVLSPRGPKTAQSSPKRAQDEQEWPQDGPKMAPRRFQDDAKTDKMALSCRRGANFAKSAMHRLSSAIVTLK